MNDEIGMINDENDDDENDDDEQKDNIKDLSYISPTHSTPLPIHFLTDKTLSFPNGCVDVLKVARKYQKSTR